MKTMKILKTFTGTTSLLDALTYAGEDLSYNKTEGMVKVNRYQPHIIKAFVIDDKYAKENYAHNPVWVLRRTPEDIEGFPSIIVFDKFSPFMSCLTNSKWSTVKICEKTVEISDPYMERKEAEVCGQIVTK